MAKINIKNSLDQLFETNRIAYNKLKAWYDEIKNFEQLDIDEAKSIYCSMLESDAETKKKNRERLILGTLYTVFHFVCISGLTAIKSPYFDIGDVVETCIEEYIKLLDSGVLAKNNITGFRQLFLREFYIRVTKNLVGDYTYYYRDEVGYKKLTDYTFGTILKKYLEALSSKQIYDEMTCYAYIIRLLDEVGILSKLSDGDIYQIYLIFLRIKDIVILEDISRLSVTDLDSLKFILFESVVCDRSAGLICKRDLVEEYEHEEIIKKLFQLAFNTRLLDKEQRTIIDEYFGIYTEKKTNDEIGNKFGITGPAIRQRIKKICNKLRKNLNWYNKK